MAPFFIKFLRDSFLYRCLKVCFVCGKVEQILII